MELFAGGDFYPLVSFGVYGAAHSISALCSYCCRLAEDVDDAFLQKLVNLAATSISMGQQQKRDHLARRCFERCSGCHSLR